MAPLLPKLRGHFAEFLNEGSSDRLSILYLPTCVGFGTGTLHLPRRFSRRHGSTNFGLSGLVSCLRLETGGFSYRSPYAVSPGRPSPGMAFLPRPAIGDSGGYVVQEYQPVVHRLRLSASA